MKGRKACWTGLQRNGLLLLLLILAACGPSGTSTPASEDLLEVVLDKSEPERILRYYFGGYAADEGIDPFEAGLLVNKEGQFFIDLKALEARHTGMGTALEQAAVDQRLSWEELSDFLSQTYYTVRKPPATLDALAAEVAYKDETTPWFAIQVDGVMSVARRTIYIQEEALRSALRGYKARGDSLLYPVGTTVIAEHHVEDQHAETTVMRKRKDGFWDFMTYGQDGTLHDKTETPPRALKTPVQCVGCHLGAKLFEPEKSFPEAAGPGPHGPRAVYVDEVLQDRELVTFFDEHRKRSDMLLGLYNTLFVARLRMERDEGRLSEDDAALLTTLGL